MSLIFVYGTLLPEYNLSISNLFENEADFIGQGFVYAKLYDIGDYPGIILDKTFENKVYGNIYQLHHPESSFQILDEYEGINSTHPEENEYIRSIVKVFTGEHELEANVYLYCKDISNLKLIPSGQYISYVKNK
ncbi:MAG: hypothetical protein RLZZ417_1310 [Bacteroidota bacterium]|jgi:gamma-glutamylcyclotransferase (GGCT)/AIG2-like uncharacterized protein YtfP